MSSSGNEENTDMLATAGKIKIEQSRPKRGRPRIRLEQSSHQDENTSSIRNQFEIVKKIQEKSHKDPIYAAAFNHYETGNTAVFATAAKSMIHVYTSDGSSAKIELKRVIVDTNRSEEYFAIDWCYDLIDKKAKILASGESGFIKVIDPEWGRIVQEKFGHGDTINEIRTDPNNSMIFASVSKDNSARIWHLHCKTALMCLGGQKGHLDQDWSPDSNFLVTCSMDHSIRLWRIGNVIEKTISDAKLNESDFQSGDSHDRSDEKFNKLKTNPHYLQFPSSECTDLHTDYVDCVRFIGWYLISKGSERSANLFRFGHPDEPYDFYYEFKTDRVTTLIKQLKLPHCDMWFLKFDISPQLDCIVFGGTDGKLLFFHVKDEGDTAAFEMQISQSPIRQVCFSPNGDSVIAVGDDRTITKILRIKMTSITIKTISFVVDSCDKTGSLASSKLNVHYVVDASTLYASFPMTFDEYKKVLQDTTLLHVRLAKLVK